MSALKGSHQIIRILIIPELVVRTIFVMSVNLALALNATT